jgi:hypothetical protein
LGHRREMADLRALHRAVWGDVSYERHLASKRASLLRHLAVFAFAAVALAAVGTAFISVTRATDPKGLPTSVPRTVPSASTTSTTVRKPPTTGSTGSSRPGTTPSRPATVSTASGPSTRARPPLAQTGFDSRPLLVIAIVLIASGIAVAARRHEDE